MSTLTKWSYNHDEKKDLAVTGFARDRNSINLPPQDVLTTIAMWISLMDSWDVARSDPNILVSNFKNATLIERKNRFDHRHYHCFGQDIIGKGIKTRWNFQFMKVDQPQSNSIIGIIDNECIGSDGNGDISSDKIYGLNTRTHSLIHGNGSNKWHNHTWYIKAYLEGHYFKQGTFLAMELDMINGKLSYLINDDKIVTARNIGWDDIDINKEYRLCVILCQSNSKIALIH